MADNGFGLLDRVSFTLFLDKERRCLRCRQTFTMRHNFGTLRCEGFHPLPVTPDGREYPCCHRRPGSDGCCDADHIYEIKIHTQPRSFEAMNRYEMTLEQFRMLAISADECDTFVIPQTWKRSDKRAVYVIDRVDFARYYEQRNVMAKNSTRPPHFEFERWRPGQDDNVVQWVSCASRWRPGEDDNAVQWVSRGSRWRAAPY